MIGDHYDVNSDGLQVSCNSVHIIYKATNHMCNVCVNVCVFIFFCRPKLKKLWKDSVDCCLVTHPLR